MDPLEVDPQEVDPLEMDPPPGSSDRKCSLVTPTTPKGAKVCHRLTRTDSVVMSPTQSEAEVYVTSPRQALQYHLTQTDSVPRYRGFQVG